MTSVRGATGLGRISARIDLLKHRTLSAIHNWRLDRAHAAQRKLQLREERLWVLLDDAELALFHIHLRNPWLKKASSSVTSLAQAVAPKTT